MKHWSTDYLGIPWKTGGRERDGLDCWGLARLVYADQLGIPMTEHANTLADHPEVIAQVERVELAQTRAWREIDKSEAEDLDGIAFGRPGKGFSHVGIYVKDADAVLQAHRRGCSVITSLQQMHELGWTLQKFYRHVSRCPH